MITTARVSVCGCWLQEVTGGFEKTATLDLQLAWQLLLLHAGGVGEAVPPRAEDEGSPPA